MSSLRVRKVRKGDESAWVVAYSDGESALFDTEGLYGPVGWDEDVNFAYRFATRERAEMRLVELRERLAGDQGWTVVPEGEG